MHWNHRKHLHLCFRTRKAFPLTSSGLSLLASSLKMAGHWRTTISRKSLHCTLSSGSGMWMLPDPISPSRTKNLPSVPGLTRVKSTKRQK